MVEQRRSARCPIDAPLTFTLKGGKQAGAGVARDISVGGMFVETETPAAFGSSVVVRVRLPGHKEEMVLPGIVRWGRTDGMGVQFGLVGARETYAITEIVKKNESA